VKVVYEISYYGYNYSNCFKLKAICNPNSDFFDIGKNVAIMTELSTSSEESEIIAVRLSQTISGITFYNEQNQEVYIDILKKTIIAVMGQRSISVSLDNVEIISYNVLTSNRRQLSASSTNIEVVYKVYTTQKGVTASDMLGAISDANSGGVSITFIMQEIAASNGVYEFASASSSNVAAVPTVPSDSTQDSSSSTSDVSTGSIVGPVVGCLAGGIALGMILMYAYNHFVSKKATIFPSNAYSEVSKEMNKETP
jgi:hypothetical protein